MSGLLNSPPRKHKVNPLLLLLLVTTGAISASSPPATLPKGFLEQLPIFLEMPDKEYQALLQTTDEEKPDHTQEEGSRNSGRPE